MLGGVHMQPPKPVHEQVCRCVSARRSHAYAIRFAAIQKILEEFDSPTASCSDILLTASETLATFAPVPWLVGQRAGHSTIWPSIRPGDEFFVSRSPAVESVYCRNVRRCHLCSSSRLTGVKLFCPENSRNALDNAARSECPLGNFHPDRQDNDSRLWREPFDPNGAPVAGPSASGRVCVNGHRDDAVQASKKG